MPETVQSLDWQRILIGDQPPLFLLEIVIRTVIIYAYSLLLIRWIGGRGIGQMSVVEFLLVVALGSAVGDAMFYPDVPLIHAMLVITLVVVINKLLDIGMSESRLVRRLFSGRSIEVIDDGKINLAALRSLKISREELFEGLRERGIRNLGRVAHARLEPSGHFSVFRARGTVSGLALLPPHAMSGPVRMRVARCLCAACGAPADEGQTCCNECGGEKLIEATIEREDAA